VLGQNDALPSREYELSVMFQSVLVSLEAIDLNSLLMLSMMTLTRLRWNIHHTAETEQG
jgi:hypothetical protein